MRSTLFLAALLPFVSAQSATCGVLGYSKSTEAYYFVVNANLATVKACGSSCTADSKCLSFAIGSSSCMKFSVSLSKNLQTNSKSPYTFYDKSCVTTTTTSSSSTVSSTTSSSKVTTTTSSSKVSTTTSSSKVSTTTSSSTVSSTTSSSTVSSTSSSKTTTSATSPTTTSTTLRTTTSISTASSAPVASSCGVVGYDRNKPQAYTSLATTRTAQACSTACKSSAKCSSFAYGTQGCLLYAAALSGNFDASAKSPWTFYDIACPIPGATSTSTSSSSTPRTTPSTTLFTTPTTTSSSYTTTDEPTTTSEDVTTTSAAPAPAPTVGDVTSPYTKDGVVFEVYPYLRFTGNVNLAGPFYYSAFSVCVDACAANTACVGVSYVGQDYNKACYLIASYTSTGTILPYYWGIAIVISRPAPSTTATTSSTTTISSTTSSTTSESTTTSSTTSESTTTTSESTTTTTTTSATPTPTPASVACADQPTLITAANGVQFSRKCGTSYNGFTIKTLAWTTYLDCLEACSQQSDCRYFFGSAAAGCRLLDGGSSPDTNAAVDGGVEVDG